MNETLRTYRLVLADDVVGCARRIELEAPNALRAMTLAQRSLVGRVIDLYEDEQPLGRLQYSAEGVWTVLPLLAEAAPAGGGSERHEAH